MTPHPEWVLHSNLRLPYVNLLKAKQFERHPSATVDCRFTDLNLLTPLAHHRGYWFREKRGDPSGLPPLAIGCFPWWCRVVKPPLRTKTLSTKVSEEELAQLQAFEFVFGCWHFKLSRPVAPATSRSEPLGEAGIVRSNFNSMVFVDFFITSSPFCSFS
jgi:hypothetical protein